MYHPKTFKQLNQILKTLQNYILLVLLIS